MSTAVLEHRRLLDRVKHALTPRHLIDRADEADARLVRIVRERERVHTAADRAIRDAYTEIGRRVDGR